MADTVATLLADIRSEAGFDVDEPTALRWLNRKWRNMVGEARAERRTVAVGNTSANVSFYPFSPVEAYSFEVDGVPYGKARRPDKYAFAQGRVLWVGDGGFILADADASGNRGITIMPTPSTAGRPITSFAAVLPADLTNDAAGNTLLARILEDDFSEELVAGAIAVGLARWRRRPDLAGPYDTVYNQGVEKLALRTKRRFKGQGPVQIRILGVNA